MVDEVLMEEKRENAVIAYILNIGTLRFTEEKKRQREIFFKQIHLYD